MKKFIILLFVLIEINNTKSQGCLPEGIIFSTQEQIDNFQGNYPGCNMIEGNVEIAGNDITNLNGLSVLNSINGDLSIGYWSGEGNPELLSLAGLEGLITIGGTLVIGNNDRLIDFTGLENLSIISGGFLITANDALTSFQGLSSLSYIIGCLSIGALDWGGWAAGNNSLTSLAGLNNLHYLGSLYVTCNPLLVNLEGLEGLTSIAGSIILQYNSFINLSGLDNITTIGFDLTLYDNNLLTDLSGLGNLDSIVGSLIIGPCGIGGWEPPGENTSLKNLGGLENLSAIGREMHIGGHAIKSLEALSNLISVGYSGGQYSGLIYICGTDSLTSLNGLDNIEAGSINYLEINDNRALSNCNVKSICNYLANPGGTIIIGNNAPGCNTPEEVQEACQTSAEEINLEDGTSIFPNPAKDKINFSVPIGVTIVEVKIYNLWGQKILQNEPVNNILDIPETDPGSYIIELVTNQGEIRTKLIMK